MPKKTTNPTARAHSRPAEVSTIDPIAVASGGVGVSASRRLADSGASGSLLSTFRSVVAGLAGVDPYSVYVGESAGDSADGSLLLDYSVAAGVPLSDADAEQRAADIADRLGGLTADGSPTLEYQLASALGGADVEITSAPTVETRLRAFPACPAPDPVFAADESWLPVHCRGRTWSDEPCEVPCAPGWLAAGQGFRCGATGEWEGDPPRCEPDWDVGAWSPCDGTCGDGLQRRPITCPLEGSCKTQRPADNRSCFDTSRCAWQPQAWGGCSTGCGRGLRRRQVLCSSARGAADCGDERPTTEEACQDFSGCTWQEDAWGPCSATCGVGTQLRGVWCPADDAAHCPGTAPAVVQACRGVSGCAWQASGWEQCSNRCGAGQAAREVWCPSGRDEDCPGAKPPETTACTDTSECSWAPGAWSACGNGCGAGVQTREVLCPSGRARDCTAEAPASSQACWGADTCAWQASAWGACGNQCGWGVHSRSVACPSGVDMDCGDGRPPTQEACRSVAGCSWRTDVRGSVRSAGRGVDLPAARSCRSPFEFAFRRAFGRVLTGLQSGHLQVGLPPDRLWSPELDRSGRFCVQQRERWNGQGLSVQKRPLISAVLFKTAVCFVCWAACKFTCRVM